MLKISLVYALPDRYWSIPLELPAGSSVRDALALARVSLEAVLPGLAVDEDRLAIFSRPATLSTMLHEGDRIELLRPLATDPKQSRRERAAVSHPKKS